MNCYMSNVPFGMKIILTSFGDLVLNTSIIFLFRVGSAVTIKLQVLRSRTYPHRQVSEIVF